MPINYPMHDFLQSRRSVRQFLAKEIPPDVIQRILETAVCAPSAHNRQPWRFVVVSRQQAKSDLAECMAAEFRKDLTGENLPLDEVEKRLDRSRSRIKNASVAIITCFDENFQDKYPDDRKQLAEKVMGIQSVAMAGLQLMLAAHAEGIGSVWTCGPLFAPEAVRLAFALPESWQPQGLILLGYPVVKPTEKQLKKINDVVKFAD
jgi:coenzyme F420-0:L-glutamate ligase / coenzyme F420-1:gamma-L-glutamate ligase